MWAHNPQLHCLFLVREGLPKVPHQKAVPKDITLYKGLIQMYYENCTEAMKRTTEAQQLLIATSEAT
jgi:hypothetical protein